MKINVRQYTCQPGTLHHANFRTKGLKMEQLENITDCITLMALCHLRIRIEPFINNSNQFDLKFFYMFKTTFFTL